ncbi:hypothetical protein AMTR_s00001p00271740 [Amborella trichopoda]|uniref:Uncharacterized protein n=1 Tax=Amborella trichopoda TaxID=13333 RepID=W1NMU3_AMBTC|nr:hypothetical protein AMTR_s00001p00271740 [Amborella trichopoda]
MKLLLSRSPSPLLVATDPVPPGSIKAHFLKSLAAVAWTVAFIVHNTNRLWKELDDAWRWNAKNLHLKETPNSEDELKSEERSV